MKFDDFTSDQLPKDYVEDSGEKNKGINRILMLEISVYENCAEALRGRSRYGVTKSEIEKLWAGSAYGFEMVAACLLAFFRYERWYAQYPGFETPVGIFNADGWMSRLACLRALNDYIKTVLEVVSGRADVYQGIELSHFRVLSEAMKHITRVYEPDLMTPHGSTELTNKEHYTVGKKPKEY